MKDLFLLIITRFWYSLYSRDKRIWVFGEWFGKRCSDNCLFFANYVAKNNPELSLYWICRENSDTSLLDPVVKRVIIGSKNANEILKKAGAVFVNQGYCDLVANPIAYYGGATFVNFWHGIPWKRIDYDRLPSIKRYVVVRMLKYVGATHFLTPSAKMKQIAMGSFSYNEAKIIETGAPRNSIFYDKSHLDLYREKLLAYLEHNFPESKITNETSIITYMPTFRDKTDKIFSFHLLKENNAFQKLCQDYNIVIIEKSHFVSNQKKDKNENLTDIYIFNLDDYNSQELLASSDILITDYSSCFFDYLILDRPIIHYIYDYDYYKDLDRGLYYDKDDVICGDAAYNVESLIAKISENIESPEKYHDLRIKRFKKYQNYENKDSLSILYKEMQKNVGL